MLPQVLPICTAGSTYVNANFHVQKSQTLTQMVRCTKGVKIIWIFPEDFPQVAFFIVLHVLPVVDRTSVFASSKLVVAF